MIDLGSKNLGSSVYLFQNANWEPLKVIEDSNMSPRPSSHVPPNHGSKCIEKADNHVENLTLLQSSKLSFHSYSKKLPTVLYNATLCDFETEFCVPFNLHIHELLIFDLSDFFLIAD